MYKANVGQLFYIDNNEEYWVLVGFRMNNDTNDYIMLINSATGNRLNEPMAVHNMLEVTQEELSTYINLCSTHSFRRAKELESKIEQLDLFSKKGEHYGNYQRKIYKCRSNGR